MGIWLFDENERHLALSVLESIISDSEEDKSKEQQLNLKSISINELLNTRTNVIDTANSNDNDNITNTNTTGIAGTATNGTDTPNIFDLLSKAKIKEPTIINDKHDPTTLENSILQHFSSQNYFPTSLKSFTTNVCTFIQENPQVLAGIHCKLMMEKREEGNK